ncbi:hypothetical protein OIU76_016302 [Salix suchowensis]|nr:hypothetical protein OIU76_016302 [Salix suchowensis]
MQTRHVGAFWDRLTSIPNHQVEDEVLWSATPSGKFTIASAWEMMRERRPVTNIHSILWHPLHIPRHSFILWLVAQCRLRTMDKMHYLHLEDTSCGVPPLAGESSTTILGQSTFYVKTYTSRLESRFLTIKEGMKFQSKRWQYGSPAWGRRVVAVSWAGGRVFWRMGR